MSTDELNAELFDESGQCASAETERIDEQIIYSFSLDEIESLSGGGNRDRLNEEIG